MRNLSLHRNSRWTSWFCGDWLINESRNRIFFACRSARHLEWSNPHNYNGDSHTLQQNYALIREMKENYLGCPVFLNVQMFQFTLQYPHDIVSAFCNKEFTHSHSGNAFTQWTCTPSPWLGESWVVSRGATGCNRVFREGKLVGFLRCCINGHTIEYV